ncbi:wiskott-Aldrich syndrome protein family member 2-like [Olea europaea var. sylvestris]|uniref:wiskott-Aldrich syndrome protein family member 2-like n=1 Tax=Olea europaea var. sylvestris TaxID=158386 RepID=UPI000C1D3454|nr:wiskott-Aldrich syndrome protein family member 2-like [Olea europaea var. sylvestris]
MVVLMYKWNCIFLMILIFHFSATATFSSKVDDDPLVAPAVAKVPEVSIKCGECPCGNPCNQQLPSLSPPPPPPPPKNQYCATPPTPPPPRFIYVTGQMPPPPSRFIYTTGPPGNLYRTDPFNLQIYSSAAHNNVLVGLLLFVACGIMEFLVFL